MKNIVILLAALATVTANSGINLPLYQRHARPIALSQMMDQPKNTTAAQAKPVAKSNNTVQATKKQIKDKYEELNQYDTYFEKEKGQGGYSADEVEKFQSKEEAALPTPLDGAALAKEIGGKGLSTELTDKSNGAGIKDKSDLADLLSSIKGAQVFMNKTPKEQL